MTPIYYRNTANGECFKVTISEGNTMKQIDNKHVCPNCYERDADGELILKVKEDEK